MNIARVGILLENDAAENRWKYGMNVFESYMGEILAHAGVAFTWLHDVDQGIPEDLNVVIDVLSQKESSLEALFRFAEQGGHVISYAGLNPLAERLGCREDASASPGYATIAKGYGDERPLRYLKSRPWAVVNEDEYHPHTVGTLHQLQPDGTELGAALLQFEVGAGKIERWAVDVLNTIVGMQQGTEPVLEDGIPAPDGTGSVNDNILKADDKVEMDWQWDRLETEVGTPYFAHPYADLWREVILTHLMKKVVSLGLTLPFIGYWPDGVPYVAMISHDSDVNQDVHAEATLKVLKECGIHSTWCMIEPGYSPYIYDQVKADGHELAFHYNALDLQGGKWSEQEFKRQLDWFTEAAEIDEVASNKNHYTRFEGWGELFEWCEKHGIASDQTRGPSKKGNIGFLFGTCHPYFPIAWLDQKNRMYDVLQVGFLTQDLDHRNLADTSVVDPFLEQVARVEGVAHFLFHQIHIEQQPKVTEAIKKVVRKAKQAGFVFWTCQQINDRERARRQLKISGWNGQGEIQITGDMDLEDVVVWIPVSEQADSIETEMKFGVPCAKQVVSVKKQATV